MANAPTFSVAVFCVPLPFGSTPFHGNLEHSPSSCARSVAAFPCSTGRGIIVKDEWLVEPSTKLVSPVATAVLHSVGLKMYGSAGSGSVRFCGTRPYWRILSEVTLKPARSVVESSP